jgi:hypothetical protein
MYKTSAAFIKVMEICKLWIKIWYNKEQFPMTFQGEIVSAYERVSKQNVTFLQAMVSVL